MKVIIAGSRDYDDYEQFEETLYRNHCHPDSGSFFFSEVVSGGARGADRLGELFAVERDMPCTTFTPAWGRLGKRAGYVRNEEMASYADALIAFWDGESRGTKHMIDIALREGLDVHVYRTT